MSKQRYALNKTKYLLDPEFDRLQSIIETFKAKDPRNALLLALALATGARAQELLNIRTEDLNDHDQSVLIRGIKGSNDRELPLRSELFATLEKLPAIEGRIFPISYHRLHQIWLNYRPVHKKFHSLRHTFAIRLYRKTKDLRLVQVALGHRNISNTMIYADYLYSQAELRKLIL
jgi:integrase